MVTTLNGFDSFDDAADEPDVFLVDDPTTMSGDDLVYAADVEEGVEDERIDLRAPVSLDSVSFPRIVGIPVDDDLGEKGFERFMGRIYGELVSIMQAVFDIDEDWASSVVGDFVFRASKLRVKTVRNIESMFENHMKALLAMKLDQDARVEEGEVEVEMDGGYPTDEMVSSGDGSETEILLTVRDIGDALDDARRRFRQGSRHDRVWGQLWEGLKMGLGDEDLIEFIQGDTTRAWAQARILKVRLFLNNDPIFREALRGKL